MSKHDSLLQKLGGQPAVDRICDALYARVLLDDELASFFEGMDMNDLLARQQRFMACLLDDSELVRLSRLAQVHQPLVEKRGLNHRHFDAMKSLLDETLAEAGIDVTLRNLVLNRFETTREAVLDSRPTKEEKTVISKILSLTYGLVSYAIGMGSLVFIGAWLLDLIPASIAAPTVDDALLAIIANLALIGAFALQHSGMARPAFKRVWTRYVPRHLERSTYVLIGGLSTIALCYFWQPLGLSVWEAPAGICTTGMYVLNGLGWLLLVASSFWINHFDLFGLRQVWLYAVDKPYTDIPFRTPGFYKYVRHPLYVGWFMALWATPVMTVGHLLFAVGLSAYILMAIRWEETDLEAALPGYRRYKSITPMLVPKFGYKALRNSLMRMPT